MVDRIKFQKSLQGEFFDTVKNRVDKYFIANGIDRHANREMNTKIIFLFSSYFILMGLLYSNMFSGISLIALYSILGFSTSLICCNFCHDVLHGSYFHSQKINRLLGYVYDINGLSSHMWRITHNIRHHTFTNIPGHDEDIDKAILLRLSPKDELYKFHRFQHIYAFFLYFLTSLNWAYYADVKSLFEESKRMEIPKKDVFIFFALKFVHLSLFLLIPMLILTAPWWQIMIGYIFMHFVGGFFSAIIFQLGHVVENVAYPEPDPEGNIPNRWAIHEMQTTSNFASGNAFWTWLAGGLNHQIEHHLFPHVCHIHYPKIYKIVQETAEEFNVPYHNQPSFIEAVKSHFRVLRRFGRE